ncbi:MAG: hypothetical protein AAB325_02325, partial [Pseudomonadota bacterium]
MTKWTTRDCDDCGSEMHVHEDWDNPPKICKSCKESRAAQWYERSCTDCGTTIKIHTDWENPPTLCKSCKQKRADQWYEKSCEECGTTIKVHRDWNNPPTYCKDCKDSNPIKDVSCSHCGKDFIIKSGTQIQCKKSGWDLPKKCTECRELFKHKPFNTVKETTIFGNTVFRTYNSVGQLISESRDEKTIFGNERRRHTSLTGKTTGFTREKETVFGTPYRETR